MEKKVEIPETEHTSKALKKEAGFTYRKLNDWDERGLLPEARKKKWDWRKFTSRELFVLLLMNHFRKHENVPFERLRWLKDFMLQDGCNHFQAAVEMMAVFEVPVLLFTNLQDTFEMNAAHEIGNLFRSGYFLGKDPEDEANHFHIVKLNPFVNRVLAHLEKPLHFETSDKTYKLIAEVRKEASVQTGAEFDVLRLMRDEDVSAIEIKKKNGRVKQVKPLKMKAGVDIEQLSERLQERDFGSTTIKHENGRFVRVIEEESFVYDSKNGNRISK